MATCPSCEASDLEVDEYDLEEGELITCPDCGTSLEVTGLSPLELEVASDEDDEDEDEEDEDDEDEDEEDEDYDEDEDGDDEREDWDE